MKLNMIWAAVVTAYFFCKTWYNRISVVLSPVIQEAEKLAQDGKIDKSDRKALVMKAISILQANGSIKLNFVERIIVSKLVDIIAEKLPDFNTPRTVQETMKTLTQ